MGTKVEYVDNVVYISNYIRNSKAIAVLWGIFTICYAIINSVIFLTPEWVGDVDSVNLGRFGLWQYCHKDDLLEKCYGNLYGILEMESVPLQISTILLGITVIISVLTILAFLLVFFVKSSTLFHICGWLQAFSAISTLLGCVAYPFGWNTDEYRKICGPEANRFELGLCEIRWSYILAIISLIDGTILATLAFILATKQVRLQTEPKYYSSLYKGEVNNAYIMDASSMGGSRKSLNLQPVMLVAPPNQMIMNDDNISQFSSRTSQYNRALYRN